MDRDVLPRVGCVGVVVVCVRGVVPATVYADVVRISDVAGSYMPCVIYPVVSCRVLEINWNRWSGVYWCSCVDYRVHIRGVAHIPNFVIRLESIVICDPIRQTCIVIRCLRRV